MESSECRRLDINLLAQALCHDSGTDVKTRAAKHITLHANGELFL